MKRLSILPAAIAVMPLLFGACAPVPRHVAFNETAFVPYHQSGSGVITGHVYTTLKDQTVMVGKSATMTLMPRNDYTTEIVQRAYWHGEKLEAADPRLQKYVRTTTTDDDGNFRFNHVPSGQYYVSTKLTWSFPMEAQDSNGSYYTEDNDDSQWVYAGVTIKGGQLVVVDNWSQAN